MRFSPAVNELEFVSPSVEFAMGEGGVASDGSSETTDESFSWNFGALVSSSVVLGAPRRAELPSEDDRSGTYIVCI